MKIDSLEKLLIHELKDLYSAENKFLGALQKMADAASHDDLKRAFNDHHTETEKQVERLEKAFQSFDARPGGEKCDAAEGLVAEGEEIIKTIEIGEIRDAALIGAAQRVEHYEMAGYGTACALARKLGHHEVADLLTETIEEEGKADRDLTRLAERVVNFRAMAAV